MASAAVSGGNLHYQIDGPAGAPVLMFSHSLGTNLSLWNLQAAALSRWFRILRYDSRGHGRSTFGAGPYSIDLLTRDALDLLDQLEIDRVHFCGLSLGGMIGICLAASAPSRVDRLILANTAPLLGSREAWDQRIDSVRKCGMAAIAGNVVDRWLTQDFRQHFPSETAAIWQMLLDTPPEGYCASCAAIRDSDQRARLGSIHANTLVIGGTYDPTTSPEICRALADGIAGAHYVELPTAHLSNIEAAEAYAAAVRDFLLL